MSLVDGRDDLTTGPGARQPFVLECTETNAKRAPSREAVGERGFSTPLRRGAAMPPATEIRHKPSEPKRVDEKRMNLLSGVQLSPATYALSEVSCLVCLVSVRKTKISCAR